MAPDPDGYTIVETLHRDSRSLLARAIRRSDRKQVLIERPLSRRVGRRLRGELALAEIPSGGRIVRPIQWEDEGDGAGFLVREDVEGEPLERLLGEPMGIERFLDLAAAITRELATLHAEGIVHRDLRPRNILVHPREAKAWILGLGFATRLPGEQAPPLSTSRIEGSLAYVSPEQTGRTSRVVDGRSDLYALGVIFFQMLTGDLPFRATRPLEWIHQHLAHEPPAPSDRLPSIPETLDGLISRLLAKLPEDRYQSARGLLHDLELCRDRLRDGDADLREVVLQRADVSEELRIPSRLFDRSAERAALRDAYASMRESGAPAFVSVSGFAGIGKSSLIRDLLEDPSLGSGFFLEGAFDRYARNTPYSGIIRAFRQALDEIMREPEDQRIAWARALQERLQPNAQLLIGILPELERLIGPQPAVLPLPPLESMRRFHDVFLRFVQALARPDHPLVLFLDDLHWADPASIAAIERILSDPRTRHLLVLGSFQEDRLDESHPLPPALERLRGSQVRIEEIPLGSLSVDSIGELVAEALGRPVDQILPLAELIHARTGGNPLFATQLLGNLAHEGLLRFDRRARRWVWDLEAIREKELGEDVLDLLISRLVRLPAPTRTILPIAACLGRSSEREILAAVLEMEEEELRTRLMPALEAGILTKCGERYRFVHDRLQQAAHRLVDRQELIGLHARIGRLLPIEGGGSEGDGRLFEITDHLNKGRDLLDRPERRRLVELNLAAGRRAFRAAGFCLASRYFSTAAELLGPDPWERSYPLAFEIHLEWAKAAFLFGDHERAWGLLEQLGAHAEDLQDLAEVAVLRIDLHTAGQERREAIQVAVEALERLGVELHDLGEPALAKNEREAFEAALGETPIPSLAELPWMEPGRTHAVVDVIAAAAIAAAAMDLEILATLCFRAARLVVERGLTESSPVVFAYLAVLAARRDGAKGRSYELGRLSRELVERHGLVAYRTKVYAIASATSQWREPLDETAELLRRAIGGAASAGDHAFASLAHYKLVLVRYAMGTPLSKVQSTCEDALAAAKRAGVQEVAEVLADERRFLLALQGSIGRLSSLRDELFAENAQDPSHAALPFAAFSHEVRKLQAFFLLGDEAEARAAAERGRELLWTAPSSPDVPSLHFFDALAASTSIRDREDPRIPEVLTKLEEQRARFDAWSRGCPHNFRHQTELIRAELARIRGDAAQAMEAYERSVREAREHGFAHDEAIAYELASAFYRATGAVEMATHALRSARACYLAWGAEAKVHDLDRRFPDLNEPLPERQAPVISLRPAELDWAAVMKAVQAISKEIGREELVERLVRTLMEQGAAQRASFIFRRDSSLRVEAEAELFEGRIETSTAERALSPERDPVSVIEYVLRTGDRVIEDDASAQPRLRGDEHIARRGVRSLLCLPVMERTGVLGIIVLENELIAGAFSPDRVIALEVLAVQAAISLEISQLVEQERRQRRKAEKEQQRAAWLSNLTARTTFSHGPEELARKIAGACIPYLADVARVDVVDPSDVVRDFAVAAAPGFEPGLLQDAIQHLKTAGIPDVPPKPMQDQLAVVIPDMDEASLRAASRDEEQFRYRRRMGLVSALAVPLVGRRGLIGVISLARRRARPRFGDDDLAFMREVAARLAVEFENAELYRASQQAVEVRDEFLSIASHELRTPIASLLLTLQRLRRAEGSREAGLSRKLELAERQAKRLSSLTDVLLDVARIQGGRLDLDVERFDLRELIEEVCPPLAADFPGGSRALALRLPAAALVVRWDRMRIEQVLTNLVTNALKFGEGARVKVSAYEDRGWIRIDVRDRGIGLSEEAQERLFRKFERGTARRHGGGLGLGLYISRKIVEAHGGVIQVQSRLGEGSTFSVRLPPEVPAAEVPPPREPHREPLPQGERTG